MTNKIALFLGLSVLVALILDAVLFEMSGSVFLARKFIDLVEWVKFWR